MKKKNFAIKLLKNSMRDLRSLRQSGQLTANQSEVIRACLADMNCILEFVSSAASDIESEEEIMKMISRISLWLLNHENKMEQ